MNQQGLNLITYQRGSFDIIKNSMVENIGVLVIVIYKCLWLWDEWQNGKDKGVGR